MPSNNRPLSPQEAPDPARSYERADPANESGMGRLDNNTDATPTARPDKMEGAVRNRREPKRKIAPRVGTGKAARP